jgi:predicted DNA-binding ribbon-helix-helix protein
MNPNPPPDFLEPEFLGELRVIAKEQGRTIGKVLDEIEATRPESMRPNSAVRVYVLNYIKARVKAAIGYGKPL